MVVFVGGNDEQRILLADTGLREARKELAEGLVIGGKLLHISGLARTKRAAASVIIVRVCDIAVDDRYACLEHRRQIAERLRCRRAKAREAHITVAVGNEAAIEVVDRSLRGDL